MGQMVLSAVGSYFFGPIGGLIGSAIGGVLFAKKPQTQYNAQQVMDDLRIAGTEYGQPIPHIRGSHLTAGQMWWNTDRRPISTVTSQSSGGKGGGGGQETVTTTITYDMDMLVGLTRNPIAGIAKIFDNGKLIWNATEGATASTINASGATEFWSSMTVYTGSDDQLPDPTYEAAVGVGNAPAYRGRSYVVLAGVKLGQSGQPRNFTFEVVADGFKTQELLPWELRTSIARHWFQIEYQDGMFMAIGSTAGGTPPCMTSVDGVTWTSRAIPNTDWARLVYGVYLGTPTWMAFPSNSNKVAVSTSSGVSWVEYNLTASTFWWAAATNGGSTWVVIRAVGGDVNRSTDGGVTWNNHAAANSNQWEDCCWDSDESQFVAVSSNGSGNQIMTSPTGTTWTARTTGTTRAWKAIAYGNGRLVAIGPSGYSMVSVDGGATWVEYAMTGSGGQTLIYAAGYFITISNGAGADSLVSADGETWVEFPTGLGTKVFRDIAYGNGELIAVYDNDGGGIAVSVLEILERITKDPPTVQDVQGEICLMSGLTADQFNVTALSSITRTVDSFPWVSGSGRSITEYMMSSYFYEAVVSDKLYFRPRGVSSVATIPYLDLGATIGDDQPEPFALKQSNDLEIPAQIAITYANIDNDYQTDTQYSDRLISATDGTVQAVTIPFGFTPSVAKSIADVMLLDQVASRFSSTIHLLGDYCRLEPTDPVTITDADSSTFRMRLVEKTDDFPLLTFKAVLDDTSILSSQGITSTDYDSSTEVIAPPDTMMELMDIPILQDADDDAGFYVATKGSYTPYPGSAIFKSADDVTYDMQTTVDESAVFGDCTTTLGDWTGSRVFDEKNTVTVDVGDGELSSSTRATLLNSMSTNAMLIGAELIQFRTATLSAPGIYVLSGLLRGCRGTEWAMTGHTASERCVLLQVAGIRRLVLSNSELGISKYYKGVTLGRPISSAVGEAFTNNAIGLKPFSPVDPRSSRDGSDNITITWQRRTRLSVRMIGALGISVPFGEETIAYSVDCYSDSGYTTFLRTLDTVTTASAEYTAADQTTDGLTPGDPVYFQVFQLSATVGRGYELEATA